MNPEKYYNAVSELLDDNVEAGLANKTAFVDPDRTLTYGQLQATSRKFANVLKKFDIRREARIALLLHDTVDYPTIFWGALRAGIVPVCLNTLLTERQYQYMLEDSRAHILVVSSQLLEIVTPLLKNHPFIQNVIVVGDDEGNDFHDFSSEMNAAPDTFETVQTHKDDTAFWLYSSGSTGDPKGTRHVHSSLAYVAKYYGQGVLGLQREDVSFSAAKLFFAYGMGASFAMTMSVGATSILLPGRPTPTDVLNVLRKHNPTLFYGVPTLYAAMLADENCEPTNSSKSLRICISAGEALPAEIGTQWKERMGMDIIDGIGSTEMLHIFLSNRPGDICYGTSGREFDGYALRLVNENGQEVAVGEIGELLVSGGSAADGYWNQREKSRATFAGIWTHTGDKYTRDEKGYYHYCGRTDDMFKVGGRWVSPFEVEQALASHPAVLEAAVVAFEDEYDLTKPKAFVVLHAGALDDALTASLKAHVKSQAGAWKSPRWIEAVDELPKTATGKIQRFKLRKS